MKDAKLAEYAKFGVAFHHAGLDTADRHTVEDMFIAGRLMLIVSTSVSESRHTWSRLTDRLSPSV